MPSGVRRFDRAASLSLLTYPVKSRGQGVARARARCNIPRFHRFLKGKTVSTTLMFTGDVNLVNVTDPAAPFIRVREVLSHADVRFANLECCFYEPAAARSLSDEGFYALPEV